MHRFFSSLVACILAFSSCRAWSDEAILPGDGWPASRYDALWTKSPFAVATPEAGPTQSQYSLWGIANIDGILYASLTDKKSSEHFLLSTNKPDRGLILLSITRGNDAAGTFVVLQENGQSFTLKLEQGGAGSTTQAVATSPAKTKPQNAVRAVDVDNDPNASPPPTEERPPPIMAPRSPRQ